eukprot:CAMPEP_0118633682 /NCGR_PEP_ID=MMETSP0785-20121206/1131_1 /TAXON_ID=91992 /ORGANISM="Bolidomonas pacifica, Strain CCMP 1866" /LENGTH=190 /DNA_ID=CAMNT_0006524581 /DNA_START=238 /DNA_END=807 /DNA_ORIENTATION=+
MSSCVPFLIPPQSNYVEVAVALVSCKSATEESSDVIYYTFTSPYTPTPHNISLSDPDTESIPPNSHITIRGKGVIDVYLQAYNKDTKTYLSPIIKSSVTIFTLQVTLTTSSLPTTPSLLSHDSPLITFSCSRPDAGTVIYYTTNGEEPNPSSPNATCTSEITATYEPGDAEMTVKAYTSTDGKGVDGIYV